MAAPSKVAEEPVDLARVDEIVRELGTAPDACIPILQALQREMRYLPRAALERVCETTEITPAQIAGVSTFYSSFRHLPAGRHLVSVCHGTACHVAGAQSITDALRRELALGEGADTDERGLFTVQKVACLGCCSLAPAMRIDDRIYGYVRPETVGRTLERHAREARERRERGESGPRADVGRGPEVRISTVSCCAAKGTGAVREALERTLGEWGAGGSVRCSGCIGLCEMAPFVEVVEEGGRSTQYAHVSPAAVPGILGRHTAPRGLLGRARAWLDRGLDRLLRDSAWRPGRDYETDVASGPACSFFARQRRIVLEGCERMDPMDLEEYRAIGGYEALTDALTRRPEDVIDVIRRSGLRGRGGGGYPTAAKWRAVWAVPGERKYVVMNADEGDPGAFMDRVRGLEVAPYRALEGLAIAAWAVGAREAYIYVREEYPRAVETVREAVERAEAAGWLGDGIGGTDFSLAVHLREGAGAFVCGEETGLIASLEGRRGMPRLRPPFPSASGLFGAPTCISNVETLATVPWILRHGADEFAAIGTPDSPGTKVFALAGSVRRGGLIEVPMGVTIREIVEEIGGGVPEGRVFKAVQIGGPSGGCLPASLADTPVDYEQLTAHGAMMGSGGLVVMDDTACMVDMARYFLEFTQAESCGKCTFCRVGTRRMLDILERLCGGEGRPSDLDRLEELAGQVRRASLCGLGRSAPNPVLTTLAHFREEYEAHIRGECPAGWCRALITYRITDDCIGCTRCAQYCPVGAIEARPYERHEIDAGVCVRCGTCRQVCPSDAVEVE